MAYPDGVIQDDAMILPFAALGILVVLLVTAKLILKKRARLSFRVQPRSYFFSRAESQFYSLLAPVAADLDLVVFSKVGLNDIFEGQKGARPGQYNRYAHMHVDFLLVSARDFRPVLGIELDGPSHRSALQQERDERKNAVFKAARLPLLRYQNEGRHNARDLRRHLAEVAGRSPLLGRH